jgi:hypothetical protein
VKRRDFLWGALAVAGAAVAGALLRWRGTATKTARTPQASPPQQAPYTALPEGSEALLLVAADVLVPRQGVHPAASEIDFLPRLDRWIASSARRARTYRETWPAFESEVRAHSGEALPDPKELQVLFGRWYEAYRQKRPSDAARCFEQLRRDVLRIYYSSPQGGASLGYVGRVVRAHPSLEVGP